MEHTLYIYGHTVCVAKFNIVENKVFTWIVLTFNASQILKSVEDLRDQKNIHSICTT